MVPRQCTETSKNWVTQSLLYGLLEFDILPHGRRVSHLPRKFYLSVLHSHHVIAVDTYLKGPFRALTSDPIPFMKTHSACANVTVRCAEIAVRYSWFSTAQWPHCLNLSGTRLALSSESFVSYCHFSAPRMKISSLSPANGVCCTDGVAQHGGLFHLRRTMGEDLGPQPFTCSLSTSDPSIMSVFSLPS